MKEVFNMVSSFSSEHLVTGIQTVGNANIISKEQLGPFKPISPDEIFTTNHQEVRVRMIVDNGKEVMFVSEPYDLLLPSAEIHSKHICENGRDLDLNGAVKHAADSLLNITSAEIKQIEYLDFQISSSSLVEFVVRVNVDNVLRDSSYFYWIPHKKADEHIARLLQ